MPISRAVRELSEAFLFQGHLRELQGISRSCSNVSGGSGVCQGFTWELQGVSTESMMFKAIKEAHQGCFNGFQEHFRHWRLAVTQLQSVTSFKIILEMSGNSYSHNFRPITSKFIPKIPVFSRGRIEVMGLPRISSVSRISGSS